MQVNVKYSKKVEAQALLVAIDNQESGRLKPFNMNVLPFTAKNRSHPYGVIIPKLNYATFPSLLDDLEKAMRLNKGHSFLEFYPVCLSSFTNEIEQTYGSAIVQSFSDEKLELFMRDFSNDLHAIFGEGSFTDLTIYISRFGTGTIHAPLCKTPANIQICVREGAGITNIVAATVDAITHLKRHDLKLEHSELRPIRDWTIANTRIHQTIKKHKLAFKPSTTYMRKNTTDRFNRVDAKYVQSLGLFSESLKFSVENDEIYFNEQYLNGLTSNEKKILLILIEHMNETVSYDSLLDVLEENNKIVTYYAVYKIIERLRKKLESLGVPPNLIRTVPKRGVFLAVG